MRNRLWSSTPFLGHKNGEHFEKQIWFMHNAAVWCLYDSDNSHSPEDFNKEDLDIVNMILSILLYTFSSRNL